MSVRVNIHQDISNVFFTQINSIARTRQNTRTAAGAGGVGEASPRSKVCRGEGDEGEGGQKESEGRMG